MSLKRKQMPRQALANGLWLGDIPPELAALSWMEQRLVARIVPSEALARVHMSNLYKIRCNVVCNAFPTEKIYHVLPPPKAELEDVLAVIFISPNASLPADFQRTPLLVRRDRVARALEWLKRNHSDYKELQISYENLADYPEDVPPIAVDFHPSTHNSHLESTAVNETDDAYSTDKGDAPFIVHGLTSEQLTDLWDGDPKHLYLKTMDYFKKGNKALGIGKNSKIESIWNNPRLYPAPKCGYVLLRHSVLCRLSSSDRDSSGRIWMEKNDSQALKRAPGTFWRCTEARLAQILTGSSSMVSRCVFWSSESAK